MKLSNKQRVASDLGIPAREVSAESIVGLDLALVIEGLSAERQRLRLIVRFEPDTDIRETSRSALRRVEGAIADIGKAVALLRGCNRDNRTAP
jgi:hypothetical protein